MDFINFTPIQLRLFIAEQQLANAIKVITEIGQPKMDTLKDMKKLRDAYDELALALSMNIAILEDMGVKEDQELRGIGNDKK